MYTQNDIHKISTASPLVYNNMGWLGDSSHRGQVARPDGGGAAAVVPRTVTNADYVQFIFIPVE